MVHGRKSHQAIGNRRWGTSQQLFLRLLRAQLQFRNLRHVDEFQMVATRVDHQRLATMAENEAVRTVDDDSLAVGELDGKGAERFGAFGGDDLFGESVSAHVAGLGQAFALGDAPHFPIPRAYRQGDFAEYPLRDALPNSAGIACFFCQSYRNEK